jgi:hypothetical protein
MTFNFKRYIFPSFRGVSAGLGILLVLAGQASFFLMSKRNKKHRLKIFLSKLIGWLGRWSPKNLLGRI